MKVIIGRMETATGMEVRIAFLTERKASGLRLQEESDATSVNKATLQTNVHT